MKIAIAYNRSGHKLAQSLIDSITLLGHEVVDLGNDATEDENDCPDGVYFAGTAMLKRRLDRLILIYGVGLASSIAANKIKGLYAAPCYDVFEARVARQVYNTNVLCLADRWLDNQAAQSIVKEWLQTSFHQNTRRSRALEKIRAIEEGRNPAELAQAAPETASTPG
jgi:ribose 5-phosphate isomerase B